MSVRCPKLHKNGNTQSGKNSLPWFFYTQKPQKWKKWQHKFLHIVSKLTKLSAYLNFPDKNKMSNIWNFAPKMTKIKLPHSNFERKIPIKKSDFCHDF